MNTKSLKTFIAIHLAVLILAAAILADLVILSTEQSRYVDVLKTRHSILSAAAVDALYRHKNTAIGPAVTIETDSALRRLFGASEVSSAVIMEPSGALLFAYGKDPNLHIELLEVAEQSLASGKRLTRFAGRTWGVLLVRPRYLLVTGPPTSLAAAESPVQVGMAFSLEPFYASARKAQAMVLGYVLINTIILVFLGSYLIGRVVVNPINRLVRMAEEYRDEQGGFTDAFYSKEKNEFNRLSRALNRMIRRISEDRRNLRASLKRLEEANAEIRARQNELIRAEKLASVGRLSAGIAHEIGNPIGIVLGYLKMLKNPDLSPEKRADYARRCEDEINRISSIIRELLDFSRPSSDESPREVSVRESVMETVRMLSVQPGMDEIDFEYDFKVEDDQVFAPPGKLRQVFLNLVINAVDAVSALPQGEKKRISISTENLAGTENRGKRWIRVSISDSGPGISADDINLIFDPFYTTKEPGKGTGLGLSVCFMIIEGLGGKIEAKSSDGRGATIVVTLPAAANDDRN